MLVSKFQGYCSLSPNLYIKKNRSLPQPFVSFSSPVQPSIYLRHASLHQYPGFPKCGWPKECQSFAIPRYQLILFQCHWNGGPPPSVKCFKFLIQKSPYSSQCPRIHGIILASFWGNSGKFKTSWREAWPSIPSIASNLKQNRGIVFNLIHAGKQNHLNPEQGVNSELLRFLTLN